MYPEPYEYANMASTNGLTGDSPLANRQVEGCKPHPPTHWSGIACVLSSGVVCKVGGGRSWVDSARDGCYVDLVSQLLNFSIPPDLFSKGECMDLDVRILLGP